MFHQFRSQTLHGEALYGDRSHCTHKAPTGKLSAGSGCTWDRRFSEVVFVRKSTRPGLWVVRTLPGVRGESRVSVTCAMPETKYRHASSVVGRHSMSIGVHLFRYLSFESRQQQQQQQQRRLGGWVETTRDHLASQRRSVRARRSDRCEPWRLRRNIAAHSRSEEWS